MRAYVEFAVKEFQNRMAYRLEFFMGIINTIITTVVYLCIYRALYGGNQEIDGVSFGMVATNFVISLGLSNAFSFDEMFLQNKVKDGSIANEFLKPVNFKLRMLAQNMGGGLFKLIFNFLPALLFGIIFTDFCPPDNVLSLVLMIVSVLLGYLVLWQLSFIIQTWCFWLFSVWGIVTIKNVFVNVLSGTMLPLWFMPLVLRKIVACTPFESIYFTPVQIYLGEVSGQAALYEMAVQVFWIILLYFIGNIFWKNGVKKLVVQGG